MTTSTSRRDSAGRLYAHPSPLPPLLTLGAILFLLLISLTAWFLSVGGWFSWLLPVLMFCLLIIAAQCLLDLLRRRFTMFSLTPRDLILQRGVLRRYNKTLILARVQDVVVVQGVLARLFDYGTLHVESAGERGLLAFEDVPQPTHWSAAILHAAETRAREEQAERSRERWEATISR